MQCLNTFEKAELSDKSQLWGKREENTGMTSGDTERWVIR